MSRTKALTAAVVVMLMALATTASAQESTTTTLPTSLTVGTPFPSVAVEAGDQVGFDVNVAAPEQADVALSVEGLPDGWTGAFRGGGFEVDSVLAGPGLEPDLTLNVNVPVEADEGVYDFTLVADGGGDHVELPLQIRVSAQAGGEVTLTPNFPGLRAAAGDSTSFTVALRNDTPTDLQFQLDASGPAGWDVTAHPASESQASTIDVAAGRSQDITVSATSPDQVDSGQYTITVQATAADTEVSADMIVEIIGSFDMDLTTADQRLNAEVTVGSSSDLQLVVSNTGTAPLDNVTVSATAPNGWDVSFDQQDIASINSGEAATVVATITPSQDAVAGDYVITFRASQEQADASIDVRTTVNPSAVWGFVGIALIALTLAALAWVFRRFGRR